MFTFLSTENKMASEMESSLAAKASDTLVDYTCSACQELDAQFHCEECCKGFCDSCVKLHNQLYKIHSVFGREQMEKWPITKTTLNLLEKCAEHSNEKIKLFCEDHSQLCCLDCVARHHRSCSKVSLIKQTNTCSTEDVHQLSSKVEKIQEELKKLKDKAEGNILSLEMTFQRIKQEIATVRQKINKELDWLERATLQEMEKLIVNYSICISKEKDKCDSIQESLQCLITMINEVCNKSSKVLFIALKKCQQQIKQSELFLKESKFTHEYDIEFAPSKELEQFLFKLVNLGRIGPPYKDISLQKKYRVNRSRDWKGSCICAICELSTGETLLLDFNHFWHDNKRDKVKLLDKKYQLVSDCDVPRYSYDMCLISSSQVVVTTNEKSDDVGLHGLQMIHVRKDSLKKGWTLQLPHKCVGIAHHDSYLYVTSGKALYQYTLTGTLVKKLYEDTTSSNTVYKCAVNLMGDKIYVTNMDKHTLLTLAMDGTVISTFSYIDLKGPQVVHATASGQVLVCGSASNTIIQVDGEGKKKLATLATQMDGLNRPCSVFYSSSTDSVLVGVENDFIVFKLT